MASALYPLGKQALMSAGINLSTDTIKAALINTSSYTYSASHQYWSSASAGLVGTAVQLTSVTLNSPSPGVLDAADTTFTAVTGSAVSAVILYKDTGTASTSPLLAYIDGISIIPNGGDIVIQWDSGTSRIFAL
jgi:hypothetical protein